ncbi:MAG: sodium:solute symporter family protein [Sedimentisphaerales bacterium]
MHWIDWSILVGFCLFLAAVSIYTKRHSKSVSDFLVANRCAGRYLLTISQEMMGLGAISFIAMFQMFYHSGFCASWWWILKSPIFLVITISGWVIYRYRETRTMTMAQFFEIRYSRKFRVFAGIVAWCTGILNMGIFPAISANFFMHYCGLPETYSIAQIHLSTFMTIIVVELSIALAFIFLGGMIVILVTEFFQGIFCLLVFVVILISLLIVFDWQVISESLLKAPENASLINPYKTTDAEGFNFSFFMMQIFVGVYAYMAWQGGQGFMAAAKNAHEAKMSRIIGSWRQLIQILLMMLIPVCAYTFMTHPNFAAQTQAVTERLADIQNTAVQEQMLVPIALSKILPVGVLGLFTTVMLAGTIGADQTYLHSWGSIFIQDVILPFRKKAFTPKQHISLLRISIGFVAIFIFIFSIFFRQNDYILMYINLTGAIYLGGAGAVIIGGLYWKRGSVLGAWLAMVVGIILAFGGLVIRQIWPFTVPHLISFFGNIDWLVNNRTEFPYNGMQINVFAICCAIAAYIFGSLWNWLIQGRKEFNMARMLHRGEYADENEKEEIKLPPTGIKAILPTPEFTGWDKFLYWALIVWTLGWFAFFLIVTACHFIWGTTDKWWLAFWHFKMELTIFLGLITTVWFLWGGMRDFFDLFRSLKSAIQKTDDDGRVPPTENSK